MVFSFFKKPEKMPERKAARPRAPAPMPEVRAPKPLQAEEVVPLDEPLPELEFTVDSISAPKSVPPAKAPPAPDDLDFTVDDFELSFTESSVMAIDVDHGGDPLQADVEQVVVLFANGQDAAARGLLETYIRSYPGESGKRFWLLLFDLLQATADRPAFDRLCVEFAEACETSPPSWRETPVAAPVVASAGAHALLLQGVVTSEEAQPIAELARLIDKKQATTIDCSKLAGCDDEVAGQLATLLIQARQRKLAVTLTGIDAQIRRLSERLITGKPEHEPSWRLLLELLQRHEWPSGILTSADFDDLLPYFEASEMPVLDFAAVRRLDFFSAGQLVNRLAPLKAAGREVIIRSPNHLVAELMAVVGLNKQARIVVPRS